MEAIPNEQNNNGRASDDTSSGGALVLDTNTTSPPISQSPNSSITSPVTSPPYWISTHQRSVSNISVESIAAGAITLLDNTDSPHDNKSKFCWAKSVYIEDHVMVNEHRTGIGAFVVWNITVETLRGSSFRVRKRYSEFVDLRGRLLQTFPSFESAMPQLPPKSLISKFRPKFLENRRQGLQYFLNCILLNPEFSSSPVLKEFLFE
ncbi:Phox homologous domain-containing protein [Bisporella sp. PMI_857]|nr:Phox homologous domain-containing protein [Bisporella sp. PMI_857]